MNYLPEFTLRDILSFVSIDQGKDLMFANFLRLGELVRALEALPDGHPEKADALARVDKQLDWVVGLAVAASETIMAKP